MIVQAAGSATAEELAYGSALHWYDSDRNAWALYDVRLQRWRAWKEALFEELPGLPPEWRPWSALLDTCAHPYIRWFKNATTNMTFTALDWHVLCGFGKEVAFECVGTNTCVGLEDVSLITRKQLYDAVNTTALRFMLESQDDLSIQRCLFHCHVSIGQVVYILACARLGIVYSCTSPEITDASLALRIESFCPTMGVVNTDEAAAFSPLRGRPQTEGRLRCLLTDHQRIYTISSVGTVFESKSYVSPHAVDDSRPLCVVYTSGSTGKPKGVVHGHGGYASCVNRSMQYVFRASQADRFLAVGTFSWITGQSYMLTGPLLLGCTSILLKGSALGSDGLRWARIVQMRGVSLLKVASAFVRHIKISEERSQAVASLNMKISLRMATFCAEPVSHDVQLWACSAICPAFVNSYWATEHGSIVLTRNADFNLETFVPDTKCWPVPWVRAGPCALGRSLGCDVDTIDRDTDCGKENLLQNIVLTRPYAGLARTLWGNVEQYHTKDWHGDLESFARSYFPSLSAASPVHLMEGSCFGFVQGDAGRLHSDGGWTFHGRSDEVLNIAGVRVGVGEIEDALWMIQKGHLYAEGKVDVRELAVVGAPDELKGEVPVVFATLVIPHVSSTDANFDSIAQILLAGWCEIARDQVGVHAAPVAVFPMNSLLPKTVTGKITRGLLRKSLHGHVLSREVVERSVVNIAAYWECATAAVRWRRELAQLPRVDLNVAVAWKSMEVDGHVIGGEPLLPAAGWLEILRSAFYLPHEPVQMTAIEFLNGAKSAQMLTKDKFYAKKDGRRQAAVHMSNDPRVFVRASFLTPPVHSRASLPRKQHNRRCVLDEYDGATHTLRCASLALHYTGVFSCVERVVWTDDIEARIEVLATSPAALFDSGLQVLCSLDAVSSGVPFIPYAVQSFSVVDPHMIRQAFNMTCQTPSRWLVIVHITYSSSVCVDRTPMSLLT